MIPDYQSIMLPLLLSIKDGKEYNFQEIIEQLAVHFNLTETEKKELLKSGVQPVFDNRAGWARTYLKKAGLLSSPRRGVIMITPQGIDVLSKNPERIDNQFLKKFDSFVDFIKPQKNDHFKDEEEKSSSIDENATPEELLDKAYQSLRQALAFDLLNKVIEMPPSFFERLVVDLLVKMGYGGSIIEAGRAIGKSGDEGIDGTIKEDKLGLDIIYIQAKRWKQGNLVGRPELQKFVGALAGQGAKKGIFITTSSFTKEALEYIPKNETKIVLVDGLQLTQLMIDFNVGCTTQRTYEVKKIDYDYFGED